MISRSDELLCDRESEAGATGFRGLVEPVEDPVDELRGDAGAGIAHVDRDERVLCARLDVHATAPRRVADRVGDQVLEDLARAHRVGVDLGQPARHLRADRYARRFSLGSK